MFSSYSIFPISDTALTIDFGNRIDEQLNIHVLAIFEALNDHPLPGMIEAVPAYSSLTIYYDPVQLKKYLSPAGSAQQGMIEQLNKFLTTPVSSTDKESRSIKIPVCYEENFAPDISELSKSTGFSIEEIIERHLNAEYRVYMLGFLPGFAYMGGLDAAIAMPRKQQPVNVAAGSVGIAGNQTGIYPGNSPGGWNIIGRTPLALFDQNNSSLTLLQPGDQVIFERISKDEFENY